MSNVSEFHLEWSIGHLKAAGSTEEFGLRIEAALMIELEEIANRENRTLGVHTTLLLKWGYEQLKAAGTTERLRRCGISFR